MTTKLYQEAITKKGTQHLSVGLDECFRIGLVKA